MPVKRDTSKRRSTQVEELVVENKRSRAPRKSNLHSIVPNNATKDSTPVKKKATKETLEKAVLLPPSRPGGQVLSMGQGDVGQLGLGPDVMEKGRPTVVPDLSDVIEACAGGMHTVCLTKNGEVVTFGCNDEGALGRETSVEGSEFSRGRVALEGKVVQVTAGDSHSAALLEDGSVYAWGAFRDSSGMMGLKVVGQIERFPVLMLGSEHRSGGGVRLASGSDHLVILLRDGHILTCGCGEQGQLGRVSERRANRNTRNGIAHLLSPLPVYLNLKVIFDEVWAGAYCTFAREKAKGDIYVCGLNNFSQLGHPLTKPIFHPVRAPTFSGNKWTMISGGQHHTLALDHAGVPYALGRKEYGRLGLGKDCDDASSPTPISALTSKKTKWVACGSTVSFAITEDGLTYSWGMGTNCQLGFGDDDSDVYEPKLIKAKQLEGKVAMCVSGGGQHAVILATTSQAAAKTSSEAAGTSKE
ncbi:regulator of chromosome condensation-like [Ischnura elegans]|uniref:regulator of chromosome condensation-like n=1 Tax=Ischnura elegans TaxID=197161 RepID=UPI001ED87343|nr:regulator of chromosome condensation-like [Ischnura elegans]XP_046387228.1 regulator of chromosome condensation-like [Ischnura elegans]XP_046387229.1 regulator of chromosome condensation-like [Ischnura elegans]